MLSKHEAVRLGLISKMNITSSTLTKDSITLVADKSFTGVTVLFDRLQTSTYSTSQSANTEITITKEDLGLDSLNNNYFELTVSDDSNDTDSIALYNIQIINNLESKDYDARDLKNQLDNLNFYYNIIESLSESENYYQANDLYFQFQDYLKELKNANNLIQIIGG